MTTLSTRRAAVVAHIRAKHGHPPLVGLRAKRISEPREPGPLWHEMIERERARFGGAARAATEALIREKDAMKAAMPRNGDWE